MYEEQVKSLVVGFTTELSKITKRYLFSKKGRERKKDGQIERRGTSLLMIGNLVFGQVKDGISSLLGGRQMDCKVKELRISY